MVLKIIEVLLLGLITKPMLAEKLMKDGDILWEAIKYPVLCTPKLDGIRCIKVDGCALSRKFKPIPNAFVRECVESALPDEVDGELMTSGTFAETTSAIMTRSGKPEFTYHIFDYVKDSLKKPYCERMIDLKSLELPPIVKLVLPTLIENKEQLIEFEEKCLLEGYEGIMLRHPHGPYKCGRSTVREGYLLKLKRFEDSEAEIIGFEEKMHNMNEATIDELGYTKRSSHKENLVPAGTLGNLIVRDIHHGWELKIGTGMNDQLRQEIWDNKDKWLHVIIRYSYQVAGMKDLPRFPSFGGRRSEDDM